MPEPMNQLPVANVTAPPPGRPAMTAEAKQAQWAELAARIDALTRGGRAALRRLSPDELSELIDGYQSLTADLARARSLGGAPATVDYLNRLAVAGHNLLYGHVRAAGEGGHSGRDRFGAIARAVRASWRAAALSAAVFFGSALIAFAAVTAHPELGFDLVPEGFYDFSPASAEKLHESPSLFRPIASSAYISNNIQVTLLAFGLGLTAGIGTTWILATNGVTLGAVGGWLTLHGNGRAFWGWVMPHGGSELLAIVLAGAAGYVLAGAILMPGRRTRPDALAACATRALLIELGAMALLVAAGLIEGLVSPSSIAYPWRITILAVSLALWASYLLGAGRAKRAAYRGGGTTP